jgi:5-methylcytosine-specific restriction endonuclease McrA
VHRRPTRKDHDATRWYRECGLWKSRHSYVSLRVHPGTDNYCIYLAGADCTPARNEALARAKGRCENCGMWTNRLELHHIEHKTKVSRCWCPENLMALCAKCHRGRNGMHVQVQWSRKIQAEQEFNRLYQKRGIK